MEILKNVIHSFSDIFRPVLSDRVILKYNKKGLLVEQPLTKEQIQPNSIDLTLGDNVKILLPNCRNDDGTGMEIVIDPATPMRYEECDFTYLTLVNGKPLPGAKKYFILKPHQFCLMVSREVLNIPNGIISFVQGRSSVARMAIQTEQAGLIDAGFRGTITFEVLNQSDYPIILYEGMRIAQVYFFKAQRALSTYGSLHKGSKYYDQIKATGSRIDSDPELQWSPYEEQ